jgi:hypothetical protein
MKLSLASIFTKSKNKVRPAASPLFGDLQDDVHHPIIDFLDLPNVLKLKELCKAAKTQIDSSYLLNKGVLLSRLNELDSIATIRLNQHHATLEQKLTHFQLEASQRNTRPHWLSCQDYLTLWHNFSDYFKMPPCLPMPSKDVGRLMAMHLGLILVSLTGDVASFMSQDAGMKAGFGSVCSLLTGIGLYRFIKDLKNYCAEHRETFLLQSAKPLETQINGNFAKKELGQFSWNYLQMRAQFFHGKLASDQISADELIYENLGSLVFFYELAKCYHPQALDSINGMLDKLFEIQCKCNDNAFTAEQKEIFDKYQLLRGTVTIEILDEEKQETEVSRVQANI